MTLTAMTLVVLSVLSPGEQPAETISVTGTIDHLVPPDRAELFVDLSLLGQSEKEVIARIEVRDAELRRALSGHHVILEAVSASEASASQQRPAEQRFEAQRSYVVRTANVRGVQPLLRRLGGIEGVSVRRVDYRASDLERHKGLAWQEAAEAAKAKASTLVKSLGRNLGKALTITEVDGGQWGWGNGAANVVVDESPEGSDGTGTQTVRVKVAVTFQLT